MDKQLKKEIRHIKSRVKSTNKNLEKKKKNLKEEKARFNKKLVDNLIFREQEGEIKNLKSSLRRETALMNKKENKLIKIQSRREVSKVFNEDISGIIEKLVEK